MLACLFDHFLQLSRLQFGGTFVLHASYCTFRSCVHILYHDLRGIVPLIVYFYSKSTLVLHIPLSCWFQNTFSANKVTDQCSKLEDSLISQIYLVLFNMRIFIFTVYLSACSTYFSSDAGARSVTLVVSFSSCLNNTSLTPTLTTEEKYTM
jgi:hypothetical protein